MLTPEVRVVEAARRGLAVLGLGDHTLARVAFTGIATLPLGRDPARAFRPARGAQVRAYRDRGRKWEWASSPGSTPTRGNVANAVGRCDPSRQPLDAGGDGGVVREGWCPRRTA